MRRGIGVSTAAHIATGLVEGNQVVGGGLRVVHDDVNSSPLLGLVPAGIAEAIAREVHVAAAGSRVDAVGVGLPGIIRDGFIDESPNLMQLKGTDMGGLLSAALKNVGIEAPVRVFNDADAVAAGLAATRGHLDRLIRVWTLSYGIGFGIYPWHEGVWEGGHVVVSLDPNERYCGCGGRGHLEGIMGHRAMRLRFLDLEPDEIFESAHQGEPRCVEFVKLWHAGLAAASASSIHIAGPGKFFISGFNAKHIDLNLLIQYVRDMVKMSTLQEYAFEVVPESDEIAVIGAAVNALRAVFPE